MICDLCKEEIETKKEKYVHVEDYDGQEIVRDIWCHLQCFRKAMNRDLKLLEQQAQAMLSKANGIFNSEQFKEFFPEEEKGVRI